MSNYIYIDGYRVSKSAKIIPRSKPITKNSNYTGMEFGRLTIEDCIGKDANGYNWWKSKCSCGNKIIVRSRELMRGHTKSCGCLHKEFCSKRGGFNKLPAGQASRNELLASYKKSALSRGYKWLIDDEDFFSIVSSNCTYCGVGPNLYRKPNKGVNGGFYYTGVDRVDNAKDYETGNVTPCCWDCNRAKGKMSSAEFFAWIQRLSNHNTKIERRK